MIAPRSLAGDYVIVNNQPELVELLLEHQGGNVTSTSVRRLVLVAGRHGTPEVLRQFLRRGANPNELTTWSGYTLVHTEAGEDTIDIEEPYPSPLWEAAHLGNAAVVEALLEYGADPNVAGTYGWTPLFVAARCGPPKVVAALLAHGARPDQCEPVKGDTPLARAAVEGHLEVMPALLPPFVATEG